MVVVAVKPKPKTAPKPPTTVAPVVSKTALAVPTSIPEIGRGGATQEFISKTFTDVPSARAEVEKQAGIFETTVSGLQEPLRGAQEDVIGALQGRSNLEDFFNKLREDRGVTGAEGLIRSLQQQAIDVEGLIGDLPGGLLERTKGLPVTEAQRQAVQAKEMAPLVDQLNKLLLGAERERSGLDVINAAIEQALGIRVTQEERDLEPFERGLGFAEEEFTVGVGVAEKRLANMLEGAGIDIDTAGVLANALVTERVERETATVGFEREQIVLQQTFDQETAILTQEHDQKLAVLKFQFEIEKSLSATEFKREKEILATAFTRDKQLLTTAFKRDQKILSQTIAGQKSIANISAGAATRSASISAAASREAAKRTENILKTSTARSNLGSDVINWGQGLSDKGASFLTFTQRYAKSLSIEDILATYISNSPFGAPTESNSAIAKAYSKGGGK